MEKFVSHELFLVVQAALVQLSWPICGHLLNITFHIKYYVEYHVSYHISPLNYKF